MIVQFMGGLGNQMFQYAFGRAVSIARNLPLFFNGSKAKNQVNHIQYMMDVYDLDLQFDGTRREIYYEPGMPFDSNVYNVPENKLFFGNWQTEKYFLPIEDTIRKELGRPKGDPGAQNLLVAQMIQSGESAFIHVRRGDYLNPTTKEYHGVQSLEYYLAGAAIIQASCPNIRFFVFSDDPGWCKANFPPEFIVVEGNMWQDRTAQWDLWLMSLCSHGVMANSSFGWWAAWLAEGHSKGIFIAPKRWFDQAKVDERDIIPDRWQQI